MRGSSARRALMFARCGSRGMREISSEAPTWLSAHRCMRSDERPSLRSIIAVASRSCPSLSPHSTRGSGCRCLSCSSSIARDVLLCARWAFSPSRAPAPVFAQHNRINDDTIRRARHVAADECDPVVICQGEEAFVKLIHEIGAPDIAGHAYGEHGPARARTHRRDVREGYCQRLVAEQAGRHRSAAKIYLFDQQVSRDDRLAPAKLPDDGGIVADT